MTRTPRKRIGELLVDAGLIRVDDLERALGEQRAAGRRERLGTTVVRLGLASEQDVAVALASQLGLSLVSLVDTAPEGDALALIPRGLAVRHLALPLRIEGNVLVVAAVDPTNVFAKDDLRLTAGVADVRFEVASASEIRDALQRAYGAESGALDVVERIGVEDVTAVEDDVHEVSDPEARRSADDQPIIRLANAILADAVRSRASDVHVEPGRHHLRVRYRIDGMLREVMRVPHDVAAPLVSRLKIMAKLDISERRRPQDGRSVVRVEGSEVDLRVATMPTLFGETVVLRLLRKGSEYLSVSDLGLGDDHLAQFRWALSRPQGLVIITGPTGSGKTSTLYAGMTEIADPVRNIITLEDPIEYQLEGINQTQINDKIGLTFARGLRSVLRQDPDVVMVGEIRDQETAQLAMQASFTGHLVLSTLHTNDAASTIVRLVDLGIEPFLISSSLLLVVGQRLARVTCTHCAEPYLPDESVLWRLGLTNSDLERRTPLAGRGCEVCARTGYRGRTALFEFLPLTAELRELIVGGATETALTRFARERELRRMREDGLLKAFAGITTFEEVLRVTPGELDDPRPGEAGAPAALTPPTSPPEVKHRPRLLVVDDDPHVREALGLLLADDYDVAEAADGEDALRAARDDPPDLILLDLKLPDVDGVDVLRALRDDESTRGIPVLVLTGQADPAMEVEGLLAGADDYLTKPVDDDVLATRLHAALRRAGTRS